MGDYNDDRQEYIPANRGGRPIQRPLSAHVSNRAPPPPAPTQLSKATGNANGASPYQRRIQSAATYRPSRASFQQAPVPAWGDVAAQPITGHGVGLAGAISLPGLFSGLDPAPAYQRPDNTRSVPSKEPENMEEELRKLRMTLGGYKEQNRLLRTERQRLEEELGRARTNLVKAEELLNTREKALSPTIGLSQMYRTPETTALVARLKEQVKTLRAEKDRFKGDLEELLRTTKATRVAELQSETHALSQELSRQLEMTAIMRYRMEEAEAMAAAAQRKAEAAEALAREYTEAGSMLPPGPVRLAPGNTLSASRVRKTILAMQQSHRVLLSQAALLRAVFPPGMTMDALAAKAALKAPTAGATEVLRYLRYHLNKVQTEMGGLPGGNRGEDDLYAATTTATPPPGPKPPRPRPNRPRSAGCGPVGSGPADGSKPVPVEPSSDPRVLLQGVADLVRELRSMDMDNFMARPELEADVDQLADVASLLIAEHKRLTGAESQPVFKEDDDGDIEDNPLYEPVPKADESLVPKDPVPREPESFSDGKEAEEYEDDFDRPEDEPPSPKEPEPEPEPEPAPEPEPEPAPEQALADGESPDEGERVMGTNSPTKPASMLMIKKENSVRSIRSQQSAPDTPVKHVEGPASSVGDPMEYGTRRSSVAGSMFSGRGWQPEGGVLTEEEDEVAVAQIAVAAVAAVVAEQEQEVAKEEEQQLQLVDTAVEPETDLAGDEDEEIGSKQVSEPPEEAYNDLGPSASNYGDDEPEPPVEPEPEPEPEPEQQPEHEEHSEDGLELGELASKLMATAEEEQHPERQEEEEEKPSEPEDEKPVVDEKEEEEPQPPPPPPPQLPTRDEPSDKGWWEASLLSNKAPEDSEQSIGAEVPSGGTRAKLPPLAERAWWEETPAQTDDGVDKPQSEASARAHSSSQHTNGREDGREEKERDSDASKPWWERIVGGGKKDEDDEEEERTSKSTEPSKSRDAGGVAGEGEHKPARSSGGNWWEQATASQEGAASDSDERPPSSPAVAAAVTAGGDNWWARDATDQDPGQEGVRKSDDGEDALGAAAERQDEGEEGAGNNWFDEGEPSLPVDDDAVEAVEAAANDAEEAAEEAASEAASAAEGAEHAAEAAKEAAQAGDAASEAADEADEAADAAKRAAKAAEEADGASEAAEAAEEAAEAAEDAQDAAEEAAEAAAEAAEAAEEAAEAAEEAAEDAEEAEEALEEAQEALEAAKAALEAADTAEEMIAAQEAMEEAEEAVQAAAKAAEEAAEAAEEAAEVAEDAQEEAEEAKEEAEDAKEAAEDAQEAAEVAAEAAEAAKEEEAEDVWKALEAAAQEYDDGASSPKTGTVAARAVDDDADDDLARRSSTSMR